jgi:hypothetical protein
VEIREKGNTITHQPKTNTKICYGKPLQEKIQLEGEAALLSFLWYGNNACTKEKPLSMELLETCGLSGCYKNLPPLLSSLISHSQLFLFSMEKNTITYNGTPSLPSGAIFNIVQ